MGLQILSEHCLHPRRYHMFTRYYVSVLIGSIPDYILYYFRTYDVHYKFSIVDIHTAKARPANDHEIRITLTQQIVHRTLHRV